MKNLPCLLVALILAPLAPAAENFILPSPATVAASSTTNLAVGTYAYDLSESPHGTKARIWATWNGVAASTNNNIVLTFVTKSPSGAWDNSSGITLTKAAEAGATGVSDWLELVGVSSISVKSIANGSDGNITNLSLRLTFDKLR